MENNIIWVYVKDKIGGIIVCSSYYQIKLLIKDYCKTINAK